MYETPAFLFLRSIKLNPRPPTFAKFQFHQNKKFQNPIQEMSESKLSGSESEDRVSSEEETDNETAEEKDAPRNQGKISDYENQRLQRIEENNRRMEALGLRKMATNFMGSVLKTQKKSNDKKGKRKIVDEDEEYNPTHEDGELSCSDDDDEDDEEFSPSKKTKMKKNNSTPKKRGPLQKTTFDSDFVDDDDALMQAIALSLQDTETSGAHLMNPAPSVNDNQKENLVIEEGLGKKKRRKPMTSRVHMNEDEMLIHFFQFDESGRGSITLRDVERLAATHDFTWSKKEMADMISCFDSDGDGKISFDDFRKIVVRCNMLKGSENDATG